MDICDDDDDVSVPTAKSKTKKKSLCRLLMQKKTRVGCLSTESEDISLQSRSPENGPIKQLDKNGASLVSPLFKASCQVDLGKDRTRDIKEVGRSDSPQELNNSTKLSLCCAMTESSRSNHPHTAEYHRRVVEEPCSRNSNSVKVLDVTTEPKKDLTLIKASSLDAKLIPDSSVQETNVGNLCRDDDEIDSRHGNGSGPISSPPSEVSSCDSSPLPTSYTQSHLRKRLLSQRRSADNLLASSCPSPSLRHSSPISSRSAPESHRYKTRSTSHDTVLPPKTKCDVSGSEGDTGSTNENSMAVTRVRGFVASMDSLARHSLLAAQVLHLIPTIKARERNFLHGRIAANSLLGSLELERTLPHRELRIFVGTWNMNGQPPPKELNDFMLPSSLEHVPDVIVVGTQESYSERFEWEVCIQETLGPSHLMLHSAALGTLHLAVFIRRDLLWFCSVSEEASYSVRPGTAFRTKGAVAIAFMLFGTSYLFITSHLTAHMEKVKERVQDIRRIMRSLDLPKILPVRHKSKDVTQNFDYVFWFGDLNFRLSQPREEVMQWVTEQEFPLPLPHSLHSDQLKSTIAEGSVFKDFEEGPITFPPTYKYDPGTQKFDTSHKQRTPAYTDRILYKCRGRGNSSGVLECLLYSSVPSICTSDHKPVWGLYSSAVRPGIDTIPLAAGLFNREVYLEGIKRRAAAMDKSQGTSAVCSCQ